MSRTTDSFVPVQFLATLRQTFPQFGEMSRGSGANKGMQGYAQQGEIRPKICENLTSHNVLDAEECYSQILGAVKDVAAAGSPGKKFVEAYMMGRMRRE